MRSTPEIVFDCCVLSNFCAAESLALIRDLYAGRACITTFVAAENLRGIQRSHRGLAAVRVAVGEGWLKEVALSAAEETRLFETLSVSLGLGEASSIAVARQRDLVFACDDKAARREAALAGVRLTGTIGILLRAVKERLVSRKEADARLARMIQAGFYAPIRSLGDLGR